MEKTIMLLLPFIAVAIGGSLGLLIGYIFSSQKFIRNKQYYKGKRIEEVFCCDCNFSKYSCYQNSHCVDITLEDGSVIGLLNGINDKRGFILKKASKITLPSATSNKGS